MDNATPVSALLGAIRAERHRLASRPGDLPSIVLNRLAADGIGWDRLNDLLPADGTFPRLRWQEAIDAANPVTVVRGLDATVCAETSSHLVVGCRDGRLMSWSQPFRIQRERGHSVAAHDGAVRVLTVLGNDQLLSGGEDGVVQMWYRRLGDSPAQVFNGHVAPITAAAYQSEREIVVAGAADGSIRRWRLESGDLPQLVMIGHRGAITALDCTLGDRLVSASRDGTLRIWDIHTGQVFAVLRGHAGPVVGCAVVNAETGDRVLSASEDGMLKLWSLDGELQSTLGGHAGPIRDLRVSSARALPPVQFAITASDDATVRLWNLRSGGEGRVVMNAPASVLRVDQAGQARQLVSVAVDGVVRLLYDGVSFERRIGGTGVASFVMTDNTATCVSADGVLTHVDLPSLTKDSPIRVALDGSGTNLLVAAGPRLFVRALASIDTADLDAPANDSEPFALSCDAYGDVLASLYRDGSVIIWSASGGFQSVGRVPAGATAFALDTYGDNFVTGDDHGGVTRWFRSVSGPEITSQLPPRGGPIRALAWTRHGGVVIGADDGILRLWDGESPQPGLELRAHSGPILDCDVALDGSLLLSASADGTLAVWHADGTLRHRLTGHEAEVTGCWIGDTLDRALSCSRDRTVKLWDLETGQCLETFYASLPLISMSVANDAGIVAAVEESGRIVVLRIEDWRPPVQQSEK